MMGQAGSSEYRRPRWFITVCRLPAAVMIGMLIQMSRYESWGAWAAAPALLIPVILSAAMFVFGTIVLIIIFRAVSTP